ncbi:MAG: IS701 family transposase [Mesorhizobium sp.]|nr:MAG: IS701 family transposase [Mesorhizobium sp.]RWK95266.1 MAG: IS701 family transposase [Mesorhizobium sp.]RWL21136.1 MAG: IS701 family transposase [Mesorhizobium sp.]TIP40665.1 MAG: IS701 family transposase [Mesorhizobium sp.]TIP70031.1 MAG: IS701 family transposase [Mesorhizobium sp.]
MAVSLSIANDAASLPIAYELYLPHSWAEDPEQRKKAKIPAEITFRTKPQIALEQIKTAKAEGVAPGVVLADAGYGADGGFRAGLSELGLTYVVGVQPTLSVWRPGESPLPPKPWSGRGRPPSRVGRTDNHKPISAKALAEEFDAETWRTIAWREGTNTELNSRFAAVRLRPASRDYNRPEAHAQEWLLIEWPEGEVEPSKYWLSTLPADATVTQLVGAAKLRWRIERDYQELKQELGLGHYEGRGWRASTTTPASVSPPMASWSLCGRRFPPQLQLPRAAKHLVFPAVIDPADPPIRPERHVPTSIPTIRRRLTVALANRLQRCPCCTRAMDSPRQARNL